MVSNKIILEYKEQSARLRALIEALKDKKEVITDHSIEPTRGTVEFRPDLYLNQTEKEEKQNESN